MRIVSTQISAYFDSINKIPDMLTTAAKLGMNGLALTDHECLCGHLKWLKAEKALKEKGIIPETFKAALGNEIYLVDDRNNIEKYWHYILIAKNNNGHRALRELSSKAWYYSYSSRGMTRVPTEKKELEAIIKKYPNTLIATTACFRKGTKVLTKNGSKNIEDITSNDFILNLNGEWEKVNYPTTRYYTGKGKKITFIENDIPTICTENHKFLITTNNWLQRTKKSKTEWVEAKDLSLLRGGQKSICLYPLREIVYTNQNFLYKKEWKNCLVKQYSNKINIKETIKLTPEVMRLFGLWLGDGHISIDKEKKYYCVGFTFSEEEFPYYWESFFEKASEEIGVKWSISKRLENHRVDLTSHSIELVELFYYLFGERHANNKNIPIKLKNISYETDINLLFGYFLADGYFRKREIDSYIQGELVSASISGELTKDVHDMLQDIGIRSSLYMAKEKTDNNGTHHQKSYYLSSSNKVWSTIDKKTLYSNKDIKEFFNKAIEYDNKKHIIINGIKYKKVYIKSIETFEMNEQVYCLNVNSHSFCCNGIIVHNCLGSELDGLVLKLIDAEKKQDNELIYNLKVKIDEFIQWNINLFGDDFYIEVAAGQSKDQIKFNQRIGIIAKAYNRKIVIGSDAHYLTAKERPLHKAYLNSKEGEREVDEFYFDAHMMDNEEAYDNLKIAFTEDEFEQMCKASMEIYDKIEGYCLERAPIIPHVEVKSYEPNYTFEINWLENYPTLCELLSSENVQERYWVNQCLEALNAKKLNNDQYLERLETEARIIKIIGSKLNNCLYEYFNTFQHYIDLFWECGSIVGPGRGSAVCFLSNYLMGITQLDPIKYNLLYFRFLNEERVELPDIDLDICPEKRELIFKKIREERGELNLIQVATFGTEGTRSAIAAAGRGYRSELYPDGLPIETTQYLSGLIPQERGFLPSIDEVINGNEEKGKKPIQAFIDEVNKYPGLLEIIQGIEGLVCRRGQHASGVMFYNNSPFETNALMRSPNGDLTTQFELHDSDLMGDVKYDILLTSISSKITTCLNLLQENNYLEKDLTLRQLYNKYLHPEYMDFDKPELWNALAEGKVMDVFQFNEGVGMTVAKQIKPKDAIQMSLANALMRLQGEKGQERPADRYTRLKNDMSQWYDEVRNEWHLTEEEIKILEPYYLPRCGTPCAQEDLMLICMDKDISNFSLADANAARKIIGKKLIKKVPELKEKFLNACPNKNFGNYIWKTTMEG